MRKIGLALLIGATIATTAAQSRADGTCSSAGYAQYRWEVLSNPQHGVPQCELTGLCTSGCLGTAPLCPSVLVHSEVHSCTDDSATGVGTIVSGGPHNGSEFGQCLCDAGDLEWLATVGNDTRVPGTDGCGSAGSGSGSGNCQTSTPEPEQCNGTSPFSLPPIDKGCGQDEGSCSGIQGDADGAPLRFSSGRVESNPITLFGQPAADGVFFGYRVQWASHDGFVAASARCPLASCPGGSGADTVPTIHDQSEVAHFVGDGWTDNFSDRLFVHVDNETATTITWRSMHSTVTFQNVGGVWKSWGGKFELLDRGTPAPADGFGRWVVRTTDTSKPRVIWSFEEFNYTSYGGLTYTLGRLRRHAVLGANLSDLNGRYGFTVNWSAAGPAATIATVVDSLSRELDFTYYSPPPVSGVTVSRSLSVVSYKPTPSTGAQAVVNLQMQADNFHLDRVSTPGTLSYTRFLYYVVPSTITCAHCDALITDIVSAGAYTGSSPGIAAPIMSTEVVLEHNDYSAYGAPFASNILVGTHTRYPGHEYAYQYPSSTTTVQLDLKFPCAGCATGGPCPAGYALYAGDNQCYVSDTMTHDASTRLPTSRTSTGISGASGNLSTFTRSYSGNGHPAAQTDASGGTTTVGLDSLGRTRCTVHNDDNGQAFSDPAHPDTSGCDAPAGAQVIRVDYNTGCTGGYTVCEVETTSSVLSGNVVEETDYNAGTLLVERHLVTGTTHDITGASIQQTPTSTRTYDSIGRVTAQNGPLTDSVALDKTTTSYYTGSEGSGICTTTSAYDIGHVFQEKQYVGTLSSSIALTTTYCNYDLFGVPHQVIDPNGNSTTYSTGSNRTTWTIATPGGGNTTVTLNPDGSIHTSLDPDGVCTAFEYTDATGVYLGTVTRMRRTNGSCSGAISSTSSGDVEIRAFVNGDPSRLQSVTRYQNGVQQFTYSGFTYDRDRRVTSATTLNSAQPVTYAFTDMLPTSTIAPGGPSAGAGRVDRTPDAIGRLATLSRFISGTDKETYSATYGAPFSLHPTQLTRGYDGNSTSVSTFVYDDFGRLVESTVPESGAPGAPTASRYEYDIAGRLIKSRVGVGTTAVRTAVSTYDSIGRMLTIDNDTEHPVNCATAPSGTPIQDVEYQYDVCTSPDVPTGFACTNALGHLTVAKSVIQCGSSGTPVKRGRWYDYNQAGHVSRVAYASQTGSTIDTPAIMGYTYSAAGRMTQYESPLNTSMGTKYFLDAVTGKPYRMTESLPTGVELAHDIAYIAFGSVKSLTTDSVLVSGSTTRNLKLARSYRTDGSLSGHNWSFTYASGTSAPDIAIAAQTYGYGPGGLISTRTDAADANQSRYYGYDALLRLTCEAKGDNLGIQPTSSDCATFSNKFVSNAAYGNGESASSPQDVRTLAAYHSDGGAYWSPSNETATYSSGSSQVQGVSRTGSNLVISYDPIGRRAYEYESMDATRSRRDYTYLPNGELGTIAGQSSAGTPYTASVRYDERGRPVTLTYGQSAADSYELYWDDANRLIAVQIWFASCRPRSGRFGCTLNTSYTSVRWHYHYLGSTLIAATRELNGTDINHNPITLIKRFWAASDERGFVYRLTDEAGATYWQARWDASGNRTWVGTPQDEMWVPFGRPGQIVLGDTMISNATVNGGTGAYSSSANGTWTRPALALNQWRTFDPLFGAFLQPDPRDQTGSIGPEGYAYGRWSPVARVDPDGNRSFSADRGAEPVVFCGSHDDMLRKAITSIMDDIERCHEGLCSGASGEQLKRLWTYWLTNDQYICQDPGDDSILLDYTVGPDGNLYSERNDYPSGGVTDAWIHARLDNGQLLYPLTVIPPSIFRFPMTPNGIDCPKKLLAHETLHIAMENLPLANDYAMHDVIPVEPSLYAPPPTWTQQPSFAQAVVFDEVVDDWQVDICVSCF